jgi:hypothetical protein
MGLSDLYWWAICPFVCALIAWVREASVAKWFLVGLVSGPFGVLAAILKAGK